MVKCVHEGAEKYKFILLFYDWFLLVHGEPKVYTNIFGFKFQCLTSEELDFFFLSDSRFL